MTKSYTVDVIFFRNEVNHLLEKYKQQYFRSVEENYSDELTLIKVRYALEVLKNESVKFIILGIIFYLAGYLGVYLFSFAFLIPNRIFSGGLHMKTGIRCFFFSVCFFAALIFLTPLISVDDRVLMVMTAVAWLLIIIFSPVASSQKPIVTVTKYYYCKMLSGIITALSLIFLLLMADRGYDTLFRYGCWVIDMQCVQLTATYVMMKAGKRREVKKGLSA